jgi:hypothetical protein
MDSDKRARIISVIGIVAVVGVMVFVGSRIFITARTKIGQVRDSITRKEEPGEVAGRTRAEYQIADFDEIKAAGAWDLVLSYGEEYRVAIEGDSEAFDALAVEKKGTTLDLSTERLGIFQSLNAVVFVTMPEIREMRLAGGTKVSLSGFEQDNLSLQVEGASNITGTGLRIRDFELKTAGAARIDFTESRVENADIDLEGATSLSITMDGGILQGELEGVGKVSYYGEVEEERVTVAGLGKVSRED